MKIENGSMVLRPLRPSLSELNTAFLAADVDVCAEVVLPWEFPETRPSAALSHNVQRPLRRGCCNGES
jgi:hypothetical protein